MLTNCENHTCKYSQSWHWQTRREYSLVNSSGGLLTFKLEPCPSKSPQTQHWHNERNSWTSDSLLEALTKLVGVDFGNSLLFWSRGVSYTTYKPCMICVSKKSWNIFKFIQKMQAWSFLWSRRICLFCWPAKCQLEKIIAQEDFCLTWWSIYLNGFPSRLLAKWRP